MIGYIDGILDREWKLCTADRFAELVESERTATLIDDYRSGKNKGGKQTLPAFIFQGYDPNVLLGKKGSRLAKALKPTGFFIMDFDHKEDAHGVYDKFLKKLPSLGFDLQKDVALAHITPSGNGLRLVLRLPKGMTIEEAQTWTAKVMEEEIDRVVKDPSRLSFCPKAGDILYINKVLMFAPVESYAKAHDGSRQRVAPTLSRGVTDRNVAPQQAGSQGVTTQDTADSSQDSGAQGTSQANIPQGSGAATSPLVTPYGATAECGDETATPDNRAASTTPSFPECYNGIPYKRIVEELITLHGGQPQIGNRENTLFLIAGDMAKITDRSQTWLETLLPTFGLPEEEWRTTIAQVCKKPMERGLSRKLQEAIKRCKDLETDQQTANMVENLPPKMPENLPSLVKLLTSKVLPHQRPAVAAMIFPALATHVNNCLFKLRDNTDVELSLMCCLLAQQSVGKGCVKPVLKQIMADIKAQDRINRERERAWQESQKNKKANEKGQSKPDDLVIRYLSSDTTPAAFLGRLFAAEHGDGTTPNLCTYSQVDEIEDLYRFCASGGKNMVQQMIKRTWDRDDIGAERFTANAANIATVLRWNWAASSTIEGGKKFFKNCLTDGTTSRVDFCTIIQPSTVIDFCYGDYDADFRAALKPYIDNLVNFRCQQDEDGNVIPCLFPQIREMEERLNAHINQTSSTMPDNTWENYAWRAKVMAIKKLIILFLANGQRWEAEFEPFIWWSFNYSMWCKLNLFYDAAAAQFEEERIVAQRGNESPLKAMRREFSMGEFAAECQRRKCKQSPAAILRKYKSRGVVLQAGDTFTIQPDYAKRFGIQ